MDAWQAGWQACGPGCAADEWFRASLDYAGGLLDAAGAPSPERSGSLRQAKRIRVACQAAEDTPLGRPTIAMSHGRPAAMMALHCRTLSSCSPTATRTEGRCRCHLHATTPSILLHGCCLDPAMLARAGQRRTRMTQRCMAISVTSEQQACGNAKLRVQWPQHRQRARRCSSSSWCSACAASGSRRGRALSVSSEASAR